MKLRLLPVLVAAVTVLSGSYAASESASDSVTYDSLITLGNRQLDSRSFEAAAATFVKARSLVDVNSHEDSVAVEQYGVALFYLGREYEMSSRFEDAFASYTTARRVFDSLGQKENVAECLVWLGQLNASYFGRYEFGVSQIDSAFNIAASLGDIASQKKYLKAQIHLFDGASDFGRSSIAAQRLDSVCALDKSPRGLVERDIQRGELALKNGDFRAAAGFFEQTLPSATEAGFDDLAMTISRRLCDVFYELEDYDRLLKYNDIYIGHWKRLFADNPRRKYMPYSSRMEYQLLAGDLTGAARSLDSLGLSVELPGTTDEDRASYYMDRGRVNIRRCLWREAAEAFRRCDSLLDTLSSARARGMRLLMVPMYANALANTEDYEAALAQHRRAAGLCEQKTGRMSQDYARSLHRLANCEAFAGHIDDGARHYIDAWHICRDITRQDLMMLPANARGKYWSDINRLVWSMAPFADGAGLNENAFTSATYEALMFSKGLLLAVEQSAGERLRARGDTVLSARLGEIAGLRNDIERLRARGDGVGATAVYSRMDSLDRAFSISMCDAGVEPLVAPLTADDIAASLRSGEAVIDFTDYDLRDGRRRYSVMMMRPKMKHPRFIGLFEKDCLDSIVALAGGNYSRLYSGEPGDALRRLVWDPLKPHLAGVSRLYFVPSGIVYRLALEAIPTEDGTPLSETLEMVRLSSSRELMRQDRDRAMATPRSAVIYGGLDYGVSPVTGDTADNRGAKPRERFAPLKYSGPEVIEIDHILSLTNIDVKRLSGSDGTEDSFTALSGDSPDILVMSTHGFDYTDQQAPDGSPFDGYDDAMSVTGVALAGANAGWGSGAGADGLLTSADIARLDLSATRLVVLSACRTALGETTTEGVFGLQRAFKKAGAGTLVMSLWPVSDVATKEFMTSFTNELVTSGWDKPKAFAKARAAVRKKYEDPFYWDGFIMVD